MEWICIGLLLAGFAAFLTTLYLIVQAWRRRRERSPRYSMVQVIGTTLLTVFLLRFSVGLAAACVAQYDLMGDLYGNLTWYELLSDSLIHAMQTFSMDEDYTAYLVTGKAFFASVPGAAVLLRMYVLAATLTNVIAPVAGGAILLNILLDRMPRLRYALQHSRIKYVFSELNEASLALARELAAQASAQHETVSILFTDAYTDASDEQVSELVRGAQYLDAFLFEEDVTLLDPITWLDRRLHFTHEVLYLLMDSAESGNLSTACGMMGGYAGQPQPNRITRKLLDCGISCGILVFTENEADKAVIDHINRAQEQAAGEPQANRPFLMRVSCMRNEILRLLNRRPLFLPLEGGRYDSLEILILGSGAAALQLVQDCYWCGQVLRPGSAEKIPLTLHLVCEDEAAMHRAEQTLRHRMPEAFTSEEARRAGQIRLYAAAPESAALDALVESGIGRPAGSPPADSPLRQVSTVFVCLEDDGLARETALALQRALERRELAAHRPVMLHCQVRDSALAQSLESCCEAQRSAVHGSCHVFAFGSDASRCCRENVFLDDMLYYSMHLNNDHAGGRQIQAADYARTIRQSYNLESSCAAAIHAPYKMFSAGLLPAGPFRTELPAPALREAAGRLRRYADRRENQPAMNRLAWLEHLRWEAYIRSIGYRLLPADQMDALQDPARPEAYRSKSNELRLHNCLVPTSPERAFFARGTEDCPPGSRECLQPEWQHAAPDPEWDPLDRMCWQMHRQAAAFYRQNGVGVDEAGRAGMYQNLKRYDYTLLRRLADNIPAYLDDPRQYTVEKMLEQAYQARRAGR